MSERPSQTASQEFREFLDSVCVRIDATKPLFDSSRDYPQEKHDKQERYRHNYLMENNFWYRQSVLEEQRQENLRLKAKAEGKEYIEQEPKQINEQGFWEQF